MVISLFAHTHTHTPSSLYRVYKSAAGGKSMMLVSHWMDAQGFAAHEMLAGMGTAANNKSQIQLTAHE